MSRVLGSLALHVVLAVIVVAVGDRDAGERIASPTAVTVEVIAPAVPRAPAAPAGGGAAATRAAPSAPRGAASPQVGRARRAVRARAADDGVAAIDRTALRAVAWSSRGDVGREGDGGDGDGAGGGRGAGIGFGDGGRIEVAPAVLALPPAPAGVARRRSRARPAQLIYPSRQREAGDDALFVARVTVDADGFVVGARLVRGRGGPRDDVAADLVFRFRYRPALDDEGRPIRSTFDQKFLVGR